MPGKIAPVTITVIVGTKYAKKLAVVPVIIYHGPFVNVSFHHLPTIPMHILPNTLTGRAARFCCYCCSLILGCVFMGTATAHAQTGATTTATTPPTDLTQPLIGEDVVFEERDGLVVVEAEHFFAQTQTDKRAFHIVSPKHTPVVKPDGDPAHLSDDKQNNGNASGGAYLEILPDTRRTHGDKLIPGENYSNKPGKLAVLSYKVHFNTPGRYYVWVRAYSTGSEDNGLHVGIDGTWPEHGQRMQWCKGKKQWYWESRQRTAKKHCGVPHEIYLDVETAGEHTISFSMREDGFEFDRWLMTNNVDFRRPQDAGPKTNVKVGKLPGAFATRKTTAVKPVVVTGELKKWHKVTLNCNGPETSETATPNPFRDYRLNATFTHAESGKVYTVPGYYAADGDARNTSADSGNQWKVHFAADEVGTWNWSISFRTRKYMAVSELAKMGKSAGFMDGATGSFDIGPTNKTGLDLRGKGRLQYVGQHYLRFAETGEYFLKVGPDAPENLLAYADFDGDFKTDGKKDKLVKTWQPHAQDWRDGDPTWGSKSQPRGKALIGGINYLASKGMNSISFLTFNVMGDDQNVFPYTSDKELERFDVSKLDQWEAVFEHAQSMGMYLHFKTQEAENQGLMDGGGVGNIRKLYYRELIARFGHHLALNWNLGEEIGEWGHNLPTGGQDIYNRRLMAQYFHDHDPYHHHVVIHNGVPFDGMLGDDSKLTGISLQTNNKKFKWVHREVGKWRRRSVEAGKPWVVACDEPGDATHSLLPDAEDPNHDNARINALWGTLMAGGAGVEWYFGYAHPHSDLTCQDWRSRDMMWDQSRYAVEFFTKNDIPFTKMTPDDSITKDERDFCFYEPGHVYVVMRKQGGAFEIDLQDGNGDFSVRWFNPRSGKFSGQAQTVSGGGMASVAAPETDSEKDWVVLIEKPRE